MIPLLICYIPPYSSQSGRIFNWKRIILGFIGQKFWNSFQKFKKIFLDGCNDVRNEILIDNSQWKFKLPDNKSYFSNFIFILIDKTIDILKEQSFDVNCSEIIVVLNVYEKFTGWVFADGFSLFFVLENQQFIEV